MRLNRPAGAPRGSCQLERAVRLGGTVNDIAAAFRFASELGLEPIVAIPRDDGSEVSLPRNPIGLGDAAGVSNGAAAIAGLDIPPREPIECTNVN